MQSCLNGFEIFAGSWTERISRSNEIKREKRRGDFKCNPRCSTIRAPTTPTQQVRHVTATERQTAIDQLARAVGEHALRQAEIDQRMATRLIELRDELSAAKDEIRSLRAQVETADPGTLARTRTGSHAIGSHHASRAASVGCKPQKSLTCREDATGVDVSVWELRCAAAPDRRCGCRSLRAR